MAFYNSINNANSFAISFTKNPRNDFGIFAKGYFLAASSIAEDLLSRNSFPDYEAYPAVFLYRHSLELFLKNVIYKAALISAFKHMDDIDSRFYNNHRLSTLAEKVVEILRKLFPHDEELNKFLKQVMQVASEFSFVDPDSFAYRYPIDKQGNPSTKSNQVMNLEALYFTMKEVLEGLDTIDFGLDMEADMLEEIYESLESLEGANR